MFLWGFLVCISFACGSLKPGQHQVGNYKVLLDTLPERAEIILEKERIDTAYTDQHEKTPSYAEIEDKKRDSFPQETREWVFSVLLPAKSEIIGEETLVINSEQLRLLNFYIGCKIALDSLQSMGAKVRVQAFDVENQKTPLKQLLRDKKLEDSDAIIGLTKPQHYELLIQSLSREEKISLEDLPWIISPWNNNTSLAADYNRFVFLRPDAKVFSHSMYAFAKKHYADKPIFIVHSNVPGESIFIEHFRQLMLADSNAQDLTSPKIVDIGQNFDELTRYLSQVDSALVIYPLFTKVNQAFRLLNHFSNRKEIKKVAVMGMPSWKDYDWGNYALWNQFQIILPLVGYTQDYDSRKTAFLKKYFSMTGSTECEDALYGHDILLYTYSVFEKYGKTAFAGLSLEEVMQAGLGFALMQMRTTGKDARGEESSFDYLQNWNIKFHQMKEFSMEMLD
jgi:hypothetical protein